MCPQKKNAIFSCNLAIIHFGPSIQRDGNFALHILTFGTLHQNFAGSCKMAVKLMMWMGSWRFFIVGGKLVIWQLTEQKFMLKNQFYPISFYILFCSLDLFSFSAFPIYFILVFLINFMFFPKCPFHDPPHPNCTSNSPNQQTLLSPPKACNLTIVL